MSLIHRMLTRQLNRLLVRDVEYMQKLQPLVGASLLFEITDLRFRATLIFHHTYVELLPDDAQPTLHLWGRSADFGKFLLLKASRQSLLQKREIDFAGDLFLLEKLEALLPTFKQSYAIEWIIIKKSGVASRRLIKLLILVQVYCSCRSVSTAARRV